jgi:hypothetical protein
MDTLIRIGGVSAILAGVLRAVGSLASGPGEIERQSLYFIIDLPCCSACSLRAQNHGRWGAGVGADFSATVVGILLVSPAARFRASTCIQPGPDRCR